MFRKGEIELRFSLLIAVSFVSLMCLASSDDTALKVTIRSHKQSYGLTDDMIFDFVVSNRTDLAIEIGTTSPSPLANDDDLLVFVPVGTSAAHTIRNPAWPRVTNGNRTKIIVPPHEMVGFEDVHISRQQLTESYIKQGEYKVFWVLKKFKEYKSRPNSNVITIGVKEEEPAIDGKGISSPRR